MTPHYPTPVPSAILDFLLLHPERMGNSNHAVITFAQNHYTFVLHGNE